MCSWLGHLASFQVRVQAEEVSCATEPGPAIADILIIQHGLQGSAQDKPRPDGRRAGRQQQHPRQPHPEVRYLGHAAAR